MEESTQGFTVTNEMMYRKLESIEREVTKLSTKEVIDHGRLKELESSTKWVQRVVYGFGVPLIVLLGGFEAAGKIWM